MLIVKYCKDGLPISDFQVYDTVDCIINTYNELKYSDKYYNGDHNDPPRCNYVYATSSELCLLVFSLRVLEEKIPISEIEFYLEDEKLKFDQYDGIEIPEGKQMGLYLDVCMKCVKLGYDNLIRDKKS